MPLQFIDIKDSKVKFVNENKDPQRRLDETEINLGNVLLENAMERIKVAGLESIQGDLLLEVALLKMGGV